MITLRQLRLRPSRLCGATVVVALAGLVAALGFQLRSVLVPSLTLLGFVLFSLILSIRTLLGLRLKAALPLACFAGDAGLLELLVDNPHRRTCWDLGIGAADLNSPSTWVDVPARGCHLALLPCPTAHRGWYRWPTLRLEVRPAPGLFEVSAQWRPGVQLLVYPRPLLQSDDVLRERRRARMGSGEPLWLDMKDLLPVWGHDPERMLSMLAGGVLQAEREEGDYGLRLGRLVVPPGRGLRHRSRCLELLTHWQPDAVPEALSSFPAAPARSPDPDKAPPPVHPASV